MKSSAYIIMLPAVLLLSGCSPDNSAKTKLFEEQRTALEKAKAVENTVQKQTQEEQQSVEKQTQ